MTQGHESLPEVPQHVASFQVRQSGFLHRNRWTVSLDAEEATFCEDGGKEQFRLSRKEVLAQDSTNPNSAFVCERLVLRGPKRTHKFVFNLPEAEAFFRWRTGAASYRTVAQGSVDRSTKCILLVLLGVALIILAVAVSLASDLIPRRAPEYLRSAANDEAVTYVLTMSSLWAGIACCVWGFILASVKNVNSPWQIRGPGRAIIILIVALIGFISWCYYPHHGIGTIGLKLRIGLPGLYSSCLSTLGKLGTPEAVDLLFTHYHEDSGGRRRDAAKALWLAGWRPAEHQELASFLVLVQKYDEAAALGAVSIDPLVEELEKADTGEARSHVCALLLKSGDTRAQNAVRDYMREKLAKIGAIVTAAVPSGTPISTDIQEVSPTNRRVVVSCHLLEWAKAGDNSPLVRGDYANKASLEAKAKSRAYDIFRSIFSDLPMDEFESVIVQCKHGVRQVTSLGVPVARDSSGTDESMIIFQTSLSPQSARNVRWQYSTLADIERIWTIDMNAIPSLQFFVIR